MRSLIVFVLAVGCVDARADKCGDFEGLLSTGDDTSAKIATKIERINTEIVRLKAKSKPTGEAKECLFELINERSFDGFSSFAGLAVLDKPGLGGDDTVPIAGFQVLLRTNKEYTTGAGAFLAFNVAGETTSADMTTVADDTAASASDMMVAEDADIGDYIGIGALFSARIPETAQQFNFGVGYMIDRVGYMDGMGVRRDRSGMFIAVSINLLSTGFSARNLLFDIRTR